MEVKILIQNGGTIYYPGVVEGAKLTWERKNVPGRLEFNVIKDQVISFAEGDLVKLLIDDAPMFQGFVFTKKRNKDGTINVTAYDQLRYLKNKDTITEENLTASDLLKRIAKDFRLQLGMVEDTGYTIETIVEENQTLFDIIQYALDETLMNTKKRFILYDDCGSLTLKNIETLKTDLLIDAETAEDFDYESSIDTQTYNKVKIAFNNEKTGKRDLYVVQDGEHMNQWGVLQYFEESKTEAGVIAKADALLGLYNQKTRRLTIKNALGDKRIRAGSAIMISLNLGDIIANQFLMVEKVTHNFKGEEYLMDMDLIGDEFIA